VTVRTFGSRRLASPHRTRRIHSGACVCGSERDAGARDRGGRIISRARALIAPLLLALPLALLFARSSLLHGASGEKIVLLSEAGRRELTSTARGGAELVPIAQVVSGLGVTFAPDPRGLSVTLSAQGREVVLYDRKSLASVGGDLRLLSAPVVGEEGRWLVPVDSLPRLLQPLLGKRVEWRPATRVLLVGDVAPPRIEVTTVVSGDSVRVVLESSEAVPFRVNQEEKRVTVSIARDVVEVRHAGERLTGGIVESVQFLGGKDNVFAIGLGRRFLQLKSTEQQGPPARLVLEFQAQPLPTAGLPSAPAPGMPAAPTPPPRAAEATGLRTVVIDPGHGGEEVGAKGPGGTLEKDITLSIARKLRTSLANSLGLQTFLTRDRDHEVPLEDRAAFANNYKADLFISIHANASRSHGARGSEVYFLSYQASDEESRRVALMEGEAQAGTPAGSDLALILWDMAQAEHLEESSALASRIQEELAQVTGSEGRGVKQAPFRVLVGAAMPAVLVEVAFISNSDEERLLASEAYQSKIVSALVRGVGRYQQQRAQRPGSVSSGTVSSPGRN
jgi:N-acetylmuramoyl-L-alanine amidase